MAPTRDINKQPPSIEVPKMSRHIVIHDDDKVELVTEKREILTDLANLERTLKGAMQTTPFLPFGTIYAMFSQRESRYFVATPPRKINLLYAEKADPPAKPKEHTFEIALPWVIFAFTFVGKALTDVYSYGAKQPVESMDSQIFRLPLPNCHDTGLRCMGPEFGMTVNNDDTLKTHADKIRAALLYFDTSRYNSDLPGNLRYMPPEIDILREHNGIIDELTAWEKWTTINKNRWSSICGLSWPATMTFGSIMRRVG